MKAAILLSLIFLVSCGKGELGGKKDFASQRYTRDEIRALCFVEEMTRLGHDPNMSNWVIDQCARIYPTQGCYPGVY